MPSDTGHWATLPPEQQRIRDKCYHPTGTFMPFPKEAIEQSIPERFEEMVRLYPDRLAVKDRTHTLSYEALNQAANQIAHTLLSQCGPSLEPIALLFAQGVSQVTAMLGILKAGKACVPLNPALPRAQLTAMLEDCQAEHLLTDTAHDGLARVCAPSQYRVYNLDAWAFHGSGDNPGLVIEPTALSGIIYTSGSTGRPKGVVQDHRDILHFVRIRGSSVHICAEDRMLRPVLSVADAFFPLLNGAAYLPFDCKVDSLSALITWLQQEEVTIFSAFPTFYRELVRALSGTERFPALRLIWLSGEPLSPRDVALYQTNLGAHCLLLNEYGATEAIAIRHYFMDHATQLTSVLVPVGYALEGIKVRLLNDDGGLVDGEQGEIAIQSRYLGDGYWRQPQRTRMVFGADPDGGEERLYRTGDLGQFLPDGCLVHLGRKDMQVKIRGNKVAPNAVEAALRSLNGISDVAVVTQEEASGHTRLIAYVMSTLAPAPTVSAWRRALREMIPDYMIPSDFVILDALPCLPNGKIDRQALPAFERSRSFLDVALIAPRTPVEAELVRLWAEVLELDQVGIDDPFLDLGGHSLLAMQLLSRVIETFQVDLPLRTLLEAPTIAEMALVITQHQADQADPDTVARLLAEVEALADERTSGP